MTDTQVDLGAMTPAWAVEDEVNLARRVRDVKIGDGEKIAASANWIYATACRRRSYQLPPCGWPDHEWIRFTYREIALMVLCSTCGREPMEALAWTVIGP
jgi:hypothetical protein